MGTSPTAPSTADIQRFVAVDDEGTGLRATWRPAHGFVNLSFWRDERCVETFHLAPAEAGRLIGFLATTLTAEVPAPNASPLRVVGDAPAERHPTTLAAATRRLTETTAASRRLLAAGLDAAARRLRP